MFDTFAGRWSLSRRIEDLRDGSLTRVDGTATLAPDGEGLAWEETGTMHCPDGAVLTVGRRYLWRRHPGGGIRVLFADGRPFHDFDPTRPSGHEAVHRCPPDLYAVRYSFDLPDAWHSVWRVAGPRKDYVSTTGHARLP